MFTLCSYTTKEFNLERRLYGINLDVFLILSWFSKIENLFFSLILSFGNFFQASDSYAYIVRSKSKSKVKNQKTVE